MKFKFTGEYEPMPFQDAIASKRKIEFEAESLGSILEQFEMFLRGCGYVFEGQIDIVNDFAETNELVDDEELDLVKNFMIGSLLGDLDGPFQIIARWKNYILNNLDDQYFYSGIQAIKSVTPEELQALTQKYLNPDEFYELVVV